MKRDKSRQSFVRLYGGARRRWRVYDESTQGFRRDELIWWLKTLPGGGGSGRRPNPIDPVRALFVRYGKRRGKGQIATKAQIEILSEMYRLSRQDGLTWVDVTSIRRA
jgi:hypothetical protein